MPQHYYPAALVDPSVLGRALMDLVQLSLRLSNISLTIDGLNPPPVMALTNLRYRVLKDGIIHITPEGLDLYNVDHRRDQIHCEWI
ncbi:hypothetical protein DSO57_1034798 [Entomophthora muscae]|uniref:Uncharacterized protein n=1 Tax=Entomophthora muscae TaxID=34485 RepID=A0ACC2S1N6_9FUNG|nr:hypothetical protein DSO57_1034798 [Entomophthora muscae]